MKLGLREGWQRKAHSPDFFSGRGLEVNSPTLLGHAQKKSRHC